MKRISCIAVMLLFTGISLFAQSAGDKILGVWLSEEKDGKIEVYKSGDKYFGKLIWGKNMYEKDGVTSRKDDKNSDAALKNRPLKDLVILTDMKYNGDNEYSGGKIYDPKSGKTYSCNMKLKDSKLDLRGYVGVSLFGRTSSWTRP
ncbi:MAG: DUF2147 domain-containing protein [Chitinophagaceae bacterium]